MTHTPHQGAHMHNVTVPDYLPILSSGAHSDPKHGGCVMEMASFLAGEEWSDRPACTHPVIAAMARQVNDLLGDADRQRLLSLLPRVMGTAEGAGDLVLSVRLAVWCARQVSHLSPDRGVVSKAIAAAVAWADHPCVEHAYAASNAADAAYAAADATYAAAAYAADAAATYAADAASNAACDAEASATYATYATYAAVAADAPDLIALLTGLIDQYDQITGRDTHPDITAADLARIREHINA